MQFKLVRIAAFAFMAITTLGAPAFAQGEETQTAPVTSATPDQEAPVVKDGKITLQGIEFRVGPCTGHLGAFAEIQVPEGYLFTGTKGTGDFLTLNQNPINGSEVGAVLSQTEGWFVIFEYSETGHVQDDEKDDLDADDLLDTLKEGNKAGNETRKSRGWQPIELLGWHKPPFYDSKTNNLTWATLLQSEEHKTINWSTRLLGRTGTMNVDLVASPDQIEGAMPAFESLMTSFAYNDGHQYAQFKQGDKIAEYGLTALIAGGAGAVALKTGLLAKLWKPIAIGAIACFAAIKKFFGFGKKNASGSTEA